MIQKGKHHSFINSFSIKIPITKCTACKKCITGCLQSCHSRISHTLLLINSVTTFCQYYKHSFLLVFRSCLPPPAFTERYAETRNLDTSKLTFKRYKARNLEQLHTAFRYNLKYSMNLQGYKSQILSSQIKTISLTNVFA